MFKIDKGVTIEGGWVERDPPEVVLESANRKEFEKKIIRETKAEVRQRPKSLETLIPLEAAGQTRPLNSNQVTHGERWPAIGGMEFPEGYQVRATK